jgi:hypothetical protein
MTILHGSPENIHRPYHISLIMLGVVMAKKILSED